MQQAKENEDLAKKYQGEINRLIDALKSAQESTSSSEKLRKQAESQLREMQARVEEAEASSSHASRRHVTKMEQQLREMEAELDAERRAHAETAKINRKLEQKTRENQMEMEEERRGQNKMKEACDNLQQKLKFYKRQIEEAEELAAINLAKYRKSQVACEEAEHRADDAESQLSRMRAQSRSSASLARHVGGGSSSILTTSVSNLATFPEPAPSPRGPRN